MSQFNASRSTVRRGNAAALIIILLVLVAGALVFLLSRPSQPSSAPPPAPAAAAPGGGAGGSAAGSAAATAAAPTPAPVSQTGSAEDVAKAREDLAMLANIAKTYEQSVGELPRSIEQVTSDGSAPRTDPWGRPYRFHLQGKKCWFSSDGPDGKPDTKDDIKS